MKTLLVEIKTAVIATLVLAVICCGIYPLVVYGCGQLLFSHKANGSLIEKDGKVVGSALLGQSFTADKYFHPRPSAAAASGTNNNPGYDGLNSQGTNLGPTSKKLIDSVKAAVEQYRKENNLPADARVPADAVTSSGSGLDPHISPRNAELQTPRVAKARGLAEEDVKKQVELATDPASLGFLGEAGVNVLELNLALDSLTK